MEPDGVFPRVICHKGLLGAVIAIVDSQRYSTLSIQTELS